MDFFKRLNAFEGVNKANEKLNHHQDFFLLEDDVFIFGKNYFRAVFLQQQRTTTTREFINGDIRAQQDYRIDPSWL